MLGLAEEGLAAGWPSTAEPVAAEVGRLVAVITTVTVLVWVSVTVGPAAVTVSRAVGTGRPIGWVELAGSEWLAPPMTTPATTPPAAASNTGRRHQVLVGSVPNMPP